LKAKGRKNTIWWTKGYFVKAVFTLIILSLMVVGISCRQEAAISSVEYSPPLNLTITEITGSGEGRTVNIVWSPPNTNSAVMKYIVYKIDVGAAHEIESENEGKIDQDVWYKNAEEVAKTTDSNYTYIVGNKDYCFFVTAIYEGDMNSGPSNIACGGDDMDISNPGSDTGKNNGDSISSEEEKDVDFNESGLDIMFGGPCGNPYYPVALGVSYAYQVTGTRSWIQTHTITDVSETGFTEEVAQDILTHIYEWKCKSEGLINTYGGTMVTENDTVNTSSEGEGITIPASISIGDTWVQTCLLISSDGKGEGELHRSLTYTRTASAMETVTVPAGTFEVIRVDYDLEAETSLETNDDNSLPLSVDYSSGSEWYGENIGLIKKTAGVKLDSMDTPDGPSVPISIDAEGVYELIEYNLPDN